MNRKSKKLVLGNFRTFFLDLFPIREIQIVPEDFKGITLPLHMAIEDASGDSAIIEFIDGNLVIHHGRQNRVMTNEPVYNVQLFNLKRYITFGGTEPIPGNTEATDRFVRASYYLQYLPKPKSEEENIAYSFGLISTVLVPFGAPYGTGTGTGVYPTWWTSVTDSSHLKYYYRSTLTPNIAWVELNNFNFSEGSKVLSLENADSDTLVGEISGKFKSL